MSSSDKKNEYLRTGPQSDFQPDPNRPEKSPIVTGDTEQKQKNSDIKPVIKKTLKEFLSDKTIEQNNRYTITTNDATTSIYNESFENFTPPLNNSQAENYHDIEFLKRGTSTNIDIARGKSPVQGEPGMKDGNTLLKANNIVENAPVNPVKNWVQSQLSVNRFNESSKYGKRGRDPNFSIQKYKKSAVDQNGVLAIEGLSNVPESKQKLDISPLKMGEIAGRLLLNASGKEQSADILPGLQQIFPGLRTKSGALDVRRIAQSIVGDEFSELLGNLQSNSSENLDNFAEIDPAIDLQSVSGRGNSFGTMNNYIDKFAGGSLSSLALSVALSVATFAALLIPTAIYISAAKRRSPDNWQKARNDNTGKLTGPQHYGQYAATFEEENKSPTGTLLGIKPPSIESFLGINKLVGKKEPADAVIDGVNTFLNLSDVLNSQGYYHVFFRNILRRTFLYARNFVRITGEGDVEYTFKIINNALNIKSSGLFDALNFFAAIGELPTSEKTNDQMYVDPNMRGYQSIFKKDLGLGYESYAVEIIDKYIPANVNIASGPYRITSDARLSPVVVRAIEQTLALDYVPFYFQDLKTNNLIKFHAFLNEYSDEYNPDYTDDSYFGRIEKVKIYKGTTRKVSFSFKVAAFSELQQQAMWTLINQLTSMAYPKYDAGNQLMSSTVKWTAPFSQSIKSSPMVRVRIGDLLVNNMPITSPKNLDPKDWLRKLLNLSNLDEADKEELNKQKQKLAEQNNVADSIVAEQQKAVEDYSKRTAEASEKAESEYRDKLKHLDKTPYLVGETGPGSTSVPSAEQVVRISDIYKSITGVAKDIKGETVSGILGLENIGYVVTSKFNIKSLKEELANGLAKAFREGESLLGSPSDPLGQAKVNNFENPDVSPTIFHPSLIAGTKTHSALKNKYNVISDEQLYPIIVSQGTLHITEIITLYKYNSSENTINQINLQPITFLKPEDRIIAICKVAKPGLASSIYNAFNPEQQSGTCGFLMSKVKYRREKIRNKWVQTLVGNAISAGQQLTGTPDTAVCAVTLSKWGKFASRTLPTRKSAVNVVGPPPQITEVTRPSEPEIWSVTEDDLLNSNPILRAYMLNQGKGAAAYIDNINYKIADGIPWDVTTLGERRPKIVDVSVSLTIVHDILPGTKNDGSYQGWQYTSVDDLSPELLKSARTETIKNVDNTKTSRITQLNLETLENLNKK